MAVSEENRKRFLEVRHKGFKDPEVLKKAHETMKRNKERKEVLQKGWENSLASDAEVQTHLFNNLIRIASDPEDNNWKWAMDILIKNGAFKMPEIKAEEPTKKNEMTAEDAADILKAFDKK